MDSFEMAIAKNWGNQCLASVPAMLGKNTLSA